VCGEVGNRQRPLPGEQLRTKAFGVIVKMSESSGPAARRRLMRAVSVWRCLFGGTRKYLINAIPEALVRPDLLFKAQSCLPALP